MQIQDAKQPAEFLSALAKYRDLLKRIPMPDGQKESEDQVHIRTNFIRHPDFAGQPAVRMVDCDTNKNYRSRKTCVAKQ